MPLPRTPLGPISSNRVYKKQKKELTPLQRSEIIGAAKCGVPKFMIADALHQDASTVSKTIKKATLRSNQRSLSRSGRPKTWTSRDQRRLVIFVRRNPWATWQQVREGTGVTYSDSTLKRILEPSGITHWKAKRRPELTEEVARLRYEWAKKHKDLDWNCVMWSDECSAERGKGKGAEWVFGTVNQKWHKGFVSTYTKGKDIRVMVWGCFWFIAGLWHRSELYVMDRDEEAKKKGYSSRSYLEVLEDQMPKCWQPGLKFMQDNAPIHTAKIIQRFFEDNAIPLIEWPPYSPDLNPIEHVWHWLKKGVLDKHPELNDMGKGQEAYSALGDALIEAWDDLDLDLFKSLGESVPKRVQAVIDAKG